VANDPTSTAARQALIGQAQAVANSFQTTSSQLQSLNTSINASITADVSQINSLSASIASVNKQIVVASAQGSGQAPNQLLDQRDALVSNLSNLVGITTSTDSNGGLNVFTGNGEPLVLQGVATTLTTVPNQFDASQLEIATSTNGGNVISSQITSGDLGGLLAARAQAVVPAINQVGQIATAFAQTANAQQNAGLDLNGQFGANLFAVGAPLATASSHNTDATAATVSIASLGASTSNNYVLTYAGGAYSLTNALTGAAVAFTGSGTAGNPISAAGLSVVLSGTPASGDQFLIQPTAQAPAPSKPRQPTPTRVVPSSAAARC
jgi:flagellar hook-associated protein 1